MNKKRDPDAVSPMPAVQSVDGALKADMLSMAQPPELDSVVALDLMTGYWQYENPGEGVLVYVIDSGCDLEHTVSIRLPQTAMLLKEMKRPC